MGDERASGVNDAYLALGNRCGAIGGQPDAPMQATQCSATIPQRHANLKSENIANSCFPMHCCFLVVGTMANIAAENCGA